MEIPRFYQRAEHRKVSLRSIIESN